MTAPKFDLEAIRARCEAATAGPWFSHGDTEDAQEDDPLIWGPDGRKDEIITSMWWDGPQAACNAANASFVAQARTDLPAALDEIGRLRAIMKRSQEILAGVLAGWPGPIRGRNLAQAQAAALVSAMPELSAHGEDATRPDAFERLEALRQAAGPDGMVGVDEVLHAIFGGDQRGGP